MNNSFPFDLAKAIQALGILHDEENDAKVSIYRLLKLLYISDREYLKATGRPIVGGRDVAMNRGPISRNAYELVKGEHPDANQFLRFFRRDGRLLEKLSDPGRDELSKREIRMLVDISYKHKPLDDDEIGEISHSYAEYEKHFVKDTSTTITLDSKLEALEIVGKRESILKDIQETTALKQILESVG